MTSQSNNTIENYIRQLHDMKPELEKIFNVSSLAVFGSYIRGEQTTTSDLDILVEFSEAPGLLEFIELENCLSDTLGIKVDLVLKRALKPNIGKNILNEAIPV
ncbi:MAG: nucleotidyltransferase family protein [Methanolobus sp.]|uniref:nucleotidyltransferase family protein n=1 Tax=Methanolobus sp. TaxID=1874737 RepID=UPI002731C904|nr:nucleotidyltransferase family protein [Methanolobus sp.]MDP2215784.1 nucleotidyltransferase family protein [Methanolobus sp.]